MSKLFFVFLAGLLVAGPATAQDQPELVTCEAVQAAAQEDQLDSALGVDRWTARGKVQVFGSSPEELRTFAQELGQKIDSIEGPFENGLFGTGFYCELPSAKQ